VLVTLLSVVSDATAFETLPSLEVVTVTFAAAIDLLALATVILRTMYELAPTIGIWTTALATVPTLTVTARPRPKLPKLLGYNEPTWLAFMLAPYA
jgi:hypothetical protein